MNDRFLIDANAPDAVKRRLEQFGDVYVTVPLAAVGNATSTHPDMQFVQTDKGRAFTAEETAEYYGRLFPDLEITPVSGIREPYPYDCTLNFAEFREFRLITKEQKARLPALPAKTEITVRQGYTKCSVFILNDSSFITADRGIAAKAAKYGLRAYLLPDGEITLRGYKNGFWGGCGGLLQDGSVFFTGNIEKLSCFAELSDILKRENVNPVYPTETPLADWGSVLRVI